MRGYFPENVSDYTKEQCEEYLAAHPNGLKADYVRERLKVLAPARPQKIEINEEEEYWKKNHNTIDELRSYQNRFPKGKHIEECKALLKSKEGASMPTSSTTTTSSTSSSSTSSSTNTPHPNSSGPDGWEVFGKILLSIGAVALVFFAAYKWHWIGTSIAAPMAYVAWKNIWDL